MAHDSARVHLLKRHCVARVHATEIPNAMGPGRSNVSVEGYTSVPRELRNAASFSIQIPRMNRPGSSNRFEGDEIVNNT
jgi:hypothetical protein